MQPLPGDRIVVRYRLGAGGPDDWRAGSGPNPAFARAPRLSDITGLLRSLDAETLTIDRDGSVERVPVAAITSMRPLSAQTVRNTQIRAVERRLTEAASATETTSVAGWTLSYSPESAVLRANAAVPLEFGASAGALDRIRDWFTARGRVTRLVVPDRLLRRAEFSGTAREYEVLTNHDEATEVPGDELEERLRLRAGGFRLHHTFGAIELEPD